MILCVPSTFIHTGVLISPWPDQILIFIYPIYNHNWRNISTILYKIRLASNEIFSPSNKIYQEVGRAKDLSASRYMYIIPINNTLGMSVSL